MKVSRLRAVAAVRLPQPASFCRLPAGKRSRCHLDPPAVETAIDETFGSFATRRRRGRRHVLSSPTACIPPGRASRSRRACARVELALSETIGPSDSDGEVRKRMLLHARQRRRERGARVHCAGESLPPRRSKSSRAREGPPASSLASDRRIRTARALAGTERVHGVERAGRWLPLAGSRPHGSMRDTSKSASPRTISSSSPTRIFGAAEPRGAQDPRARALGPGRAAPGDYMVRRHGIGIYRGLKHIVATVVEPRRLHPSQYAGGDRLYLPVDRINLVEKYRARAERRPLAARSQQWARRSARRRSDPEARARAARARKRFAPITRDAFAQTDTDTKVRRTSVRKTEVRRSVAGSSRPHAF